MISYELAKKLKDVGFPQEVICHEDRWTCCEHSMYFDAHTGERNDVPYYPTLSELIDACGDGYFTLQSSQLGWEASAGLTQDKFGRGSTPEEAVANLWLALNEKKQ